MALFVFAWPGNIVSRGWSGAVEIPAAQNHSTVFTLPKPAYSPLPGLAQFQEHLLVPKLGQACDRPWVPEISKTRLLPWDPCFMVSAARIVCTRCLQDLHFTKLLLIRH